MRNACEKHAKSMLKEVFKGVERHFAERYEAVVDHPRPRDLLWLLGLLLQRLPGDAAT